MPIGTVGDRVRILNLDVPDNSKSVRNRVAVDATGREKSLRNVHVDYEQQAIKTGRRQTKELWSALPDDLRESNGGP